MSATTRLAIFCLILLQPVLCPASRYWYQERRGDRIMTNCLTVAVAGARRTAVLSNRRGVSVLVTDPAGLRTFRSSSQDRDGRSSFEAVLRENMLDIRIVGDDKTNRLTQGPLKEVWAQDVTMIQLAGFLPADAALKHCAVHESTGKFYYLAVQRDGEESMEVAGRTTAVIRVVQTARGVPRSLWSALYWYRKSDGLLVRERAVFGGPGTPESVTVLIREE